MAFFEDQVGLKYKPDITGLRELARSAGWWWPFRGGVILTERPHTLNRDTEHRLHGENGAAIQYPDGWGIWAWHGVRVPLQVIESPETLTIAQINDERNAEVRRIMMERFGHARYIRESGARKLHQDEWGTLWRTEVPDDEPLVMVELVNSTPEPDGHFRDYMIRVPSDVQTAHQAVAWTFRLEAHEYVPLAQT